MVLLLVWGRTAGNVTSCIPKRGNLPLARIQVSSARAYHWRKRSRRMPVQVTMPTGTKPVCPCLSRGKVHGKLLPAARLRDLHIVFFSPRPSLSNGDISCKKKAGRQTRTHTHAHCTHHSEWPTKEHLRAHAHPSEWPTKENPRAHAHLNRLHHHTSPDHTNTQHHTTPSQLALPRHHSSP